MIHAVSVKNYQKYPLLLLLKQGNILDEVIKFQGVNLYKTTLCKKYSILKYMYAQWPYWKSFTKERFQIPVYDEQGHWVPNTTTLK